jgi:S-adenosylmethionine hydrolase
VASRITLLSDFGTRDGYAGAVKGVIARILPVVTLDDISHDIPPGDVWSAAYALARYWRLYPVGTVHLAVVDPGVGTARSALACRAEGRFLVAPDNGVLSRVLDDAASWKTVELRGVELPEDVRTGASATFHARDLFAPAAARLAMGVELERLGPELPDPVRLREPEPERDGRGGAGEVVAIDRFGNLLTNLPGGWIPSASAHVEVGGSSIQLRRTYGEAEPDELLALVGSDGRLEIAVREGSAAARLKARRGTAVRLTSEAAEPRPS